MSVPRDPVATAAKVTSELKAARLHQDLEYELAMGHDRGAEWDGAAEAALDDLEKRFGGAEALRSKDVAKRTPDGKGTLGPLADRKKTPASSAGDKASTSGAKDGAKTSTPPAGKPRQPAGSPRGRGRRSGSRSRAGRGARSFGSRVVNVSGAGDAGAMVMTVLAGTVALVLVYVLIRGKKPGAAGAGADAIAWASSSLVNGLSAFMSPTDPLNPAKAKKTAKPSADVVPGSAGDGLANGGLVGGFPITPGRSIPGVGQAVPVNP